MSDPTTPAACRHLNNAARVDVYRIEDSETWGASITAWCADCGTPYSFIGFERGISMRGPMVNPDATELRVPIVVGAQPLLLGPHKVEL